MPYMGLAQDASMLVAAKTASYSVQPNDNNTVFTNRGAGGAVTFTLPTIASLDSGFNVWFFVAADQSVTISCPEGDKIVTFNDIAADTVAYSTASKKVGASCHFIYDGTGWLVMNGMWNTATDGTTQNLVTITT